MRIRSLVARLTGSAIVIAFAAAAVVAGMPARCLLAQHCERCEEVAGPAIGLGGCPEMAPAAPAAQDETPPMLAVLRAPLAARPLALLEKSRFSLTPNGAVAAFHDGGSPGGLALRI